MASPVSFGDAFALLVQIYHVYDDYKTTPEKLRQVLQRFRIAERELEALNKVLASSRRAEYRSYPHTADLVSDLAGARDYFQRFEPLTDESGKVSMISRVKGTVRAKWDDTKVQAYVTKMNLHRDSMNNFKQTVLIQAAQDNIELQIGAIQLQLGRTGGVGLSRTFPAKTDDDSSSVSSDCISVLTRASKSLTMADRLESLPANRRPLTLSPILESNVSAVASLGDASGDLRRIIADYVESKELYRPGDLQDTRLQELQYVADLPKRWLASQQDGRSQRPQTRLQTPSKSVTSQSNGSDVTLSLPSDITHTTYTDDDLETSSISPSWTQALNSVGSASRRSIPSLQFSEHLPSPILSSDTDSISRIMESSLPDGGEDDDQKIMLENSVMLFTPWTRDTPIPCTLELMQSASSLHLRSTTKQSFQHGAISALGTRSGITPASILSLRNSVSTSHDTAETQRLVFNHAALSGMRSFPKILHPRVESAMAGSHKYSIVFYTHQFLNLEGDNQREKAVKGVAYHFKHKEERDLVREKIFGKKLLASTGISTIQFDKKSSTKPCGTEAISLWTTTTDNTDSENLTVTIQCSTKGRPEPDCAQEFEVLKAKNLTKARDNLNKELDLVLQLVPLLDPLEDTVAASGGIMSSDASIVSYGSEFGSSSGSHWSSIFGSRRQSFAGSVIGVEPQDSKSFHCFIKFTEGADGLTASKRRFLDALRAHSPS